MVQKSFNFKVEEEVIATWKKRKGDETWVRYFSRLSDADAGVKTVVDPGRLSEDNRILNELIEFIALKDFGGKSKFSNVVSTLNKQVEATGRSKIELAKEWVDRLKAEISVGDRIESGNKILSSRVVLKIATEMQKEANKEIIQADGVKILRVVPVSVESLTERLKSEGLSPEDIAKCIQDHIEMKTFLVPRIGYVQVAM